MKDKYKHLLNFTANIISLAVEAAMFGWVWYMLYIPMLDKANTFFNRGNWAVIGMYVLFVFFFTKIFGGYRIGYMRISDIILSQILAVVLAEDYLQKSDRLILPEEMWYISVPVSVHWYFPLSLAGEEDMNRRHTGYITFRL